MTDQKMREVVLVIQKGKLIEIKRRVLRVKELINHVTRIKEDLTRIETIKTEIVHRDQMTTLRKPNFRKGKINQI